MNYTKQNYQRKTSNRKGKGCSYLTSGGKAVRKHAREVTSQNKSKQSENERKEFDSVVTNIAFHHI